MEEKGRRRSGGEEVRATASCNTCTRCSFCLEWDGARPVCPSSAYRPFATYRPYGRLELARRISEAGPRGFTKDDVSLVAPMLACTLCGACDQRCNELTGKRLLELLRDARGKMVSLGLAPPETHRTLLNNITRYGNPQGMPNTAKRNRLAASLREAGAAMRPRIGEDLLYFIGCTPALSDNIPSQLRNMVSILTHSGTGFSVVGGEDGELCCGHVLFNTGQQALATEYLGRAYGAVSSTGAERVLFTCPACYRSFKYEIPRLLGITPSFSCITASEFIAGLVKEGKLRVNQGGSKEVVTYHDPCHLGRLSGVYEAPRELILATGAELVEMPRNRERAWCCGSGGGVKMAFPEMAQSTALALVDEAISVGARTIVTACPACESGIIDAIRLAADIRGVRVVDVIDIVAACMTR